MEKVYKILEKIQLWCSRNLSVQAIFFVVALLFSFVSYWFVLGVAITYLAQNLSSQVVFEKAVKDVIWLAAGSLLCLIFKVLL